MTVNYRSRSSERRKERKKNARPFSAAPPFSAYIERAKWTMPGTRRISALLLIKNCIIQSRSAQTAATRNTYVDAPI